MSNIVTTEQKQTEQSLATSQTIDVYIQEAVNKWNDFEGKKAALILDLARKISELPGVEKDKIARTIVGRFRKFGVQIQKRYVYRILPAEYKNDAISEAATENNKLRQENGYDAKLGAYFDPKTYDMNNLLAYSRTSLVRIIEHLDQENRALKKQIEALEASKG